MGRRFGVCTSWLGLVSLLWGCGSSPLSDGKPLALDQACRDLAQAACAAFQRCTPENFGHAYPDLESCVSLRTADCVERRGAPGNSVTPDGVEACAHATSRLKCDAIVASEFNGAAPRDPACVWQGTLPDGEACITSSQCATGTCSFYDRDACGTCLTRTDASCVVDSECLVGSRCIDGQCFAGGKLGDACGESSVCNVGLTCRAGQCAPLAAAGEPCVAEGSGGCAPGLWCNYQRLQCEHSILLSGSRGECGVAASGSNVLCPAGNECLPDPETGTSRCVPAAAEGAPCSYQAECGVGLGCYESSCTQLHAARCAAPGTMANPQYPALLPSVPQAVSPTSRMLLTTPKVVLVTFAGDSRADTLEPYLQALGASGYWHSTTAEYGIAALSALPPIRVQEAPASTVTDADIRAWLTDKLTSDSRFPASDGLTLYVVVYPTGVAITVPGPNAQVGRSCFDFGGYHDSFSGPGGMPTPYAVIPDCHFSDTEAAISHEVVEAVTDPFSDLSQLALASTLGYAALDSSHLAWALPSAGGAELADLCEWQPLADYQDAEIGGSVQRSWSNAAMAGFHQPCVPALPGVYFNSVPHFDDVVSVQFQGQLARTRGVAIRVGESKTIAVDLLSDGDTGGPWRVSAYDLKEWNHQFSSSAQVEPTLHFAFDQQSGLNGDTLHMTVTVLKPDSDYGAEPFMLVSRRGHEIHLWPGLVGQP